ncbi:MAG: PIN domain-containing protein [Bryobacteraceae bacterium]
MKVYFDTSVLVAAAVKGHAHHGPAFSALEESVAKGRHGFMSAHGMAELYAVLTRAPFTPAVYPSEAWQILEQSFLPSMEVVALTAEEYRRVVRECASHGWAGGKIYDALHVQCARKAGCDRIYTFNVRDFQRLAPELQAKVCAP